MLLLSSTLLYCRGVYIGIKQSRQDNTCEIVILSPLLEIYLPIRMPIPYPHPIWLAGKYQQVTVTRYAKV